MIYFTVIKTNLPAFSYLYHYSKELRQKIESNQQREHAREEQRITAMQRRREHREAIQQQREKAIEETVKRRNVSNFDLDRAVVGDLIVSYLTKGRHRK